MASEIMINRSEIKHSEIGSSLSINRNANGSISD